MHFGGQIDYIVWAINVQTEITQNSHLCANICVCKWFWYINHIISWPKSNQRVFNMYMLHWITLSSAIFLYVFILLLSHSSISETQNFGFDDRTMFRWTHSNTLDFSKTHRRICAADHSRIISRRCCQIEWWICSRAYMPVVCREDRIRSVVCWAKVHAPRTYKKAWHGAARTRGWSRNDDDIAEESGRKSFQGSCKSSVQGMRMYVYGIMGCRQVARQLWREITFRLFVL